MYKAIRTTIKLGDIELDVFQLPNGSYWMSLSQMAETLRFDKRRGSDLLALEVIKTLATYDVQGSGFIAEDSKQTIKGITLDAVSTICGYYALKGNLQAQAIMFACLVEALERRADFAFNVTRSEDERNDRLKQRMQGKVARRTLTDAIDDWMARHPDLVSENYQKFIYSNASNYLNRTILGANAKCLREKLAIPQNSLLRDYVPVKALRELELIEEFASRLIDEDEIEPYTAVKQSCLVMKAKLIQI